MEKLKEIIKESEMLSSKEQKTFKLIYSANESLLIKNNEKPGIFIPMDLVVDNTEIIKYFKSRYMKYLDVNNTNVHLDAILEQFAVIYYRKLSFPLSIEHGLSVHDPEMILGGRFVGEPVLSSDAENGILHNSALIEKKDILDLIKHAFESCQKFNDGSVSHESFLDSIDERYCQLVTAKVCANPTCSPATISKYQNEIDELLEMSAKAFELTNFPVRLGEEFKIIDVDDSLIEKFEKIKNNMPIEFPFELDDFQKKAVYLIEQAENVLVAAHTSAGKTVVAEYAIAASNLLGKKTIYTSPIKALSNQKFNDFKKKFRDVGIVTGDIQINDTAQNVVMTTEILRSMLYRDIGSKLNDVAYVIFDEVHYINDEERGVVWEEILIMLPKHVKLVLLSATVPNCHEVASWIGKVRKQVINVVITHKRPVPLQHILYYATNYNRRNDFLEVIDTRGNFLEHNFMTVEQVLKYREEENIYKRGKGINKNHIFALVDHLWEQQKLPCIVFLFSRQGCFEIADKFINRDFTTKAEKNMIKTFFCSSISCLNEKNKNLYRITWFREICMRGIGVHHSGVLPILREIVEILFQRELIKVLIATETFAIGVNMPAKTVVFTALEKFTGTQTRNLLSSEYIQMAGRAGRRGQDTIGSVYVMAGSSLLPKQEFTEMALGSALKITSRFRLSYGMILNLLSTSRMETSKVEHVMKSSFTEFIQLNSSNEMVFTIEGLKADLERLKTVANVCTLCMDLESYCSAFEQYFSVWTSILKSSVSSTKQMANFYQRGRVVFIKVEGPINCRPAIILDMPKHINKSTQAFSDPSFMSVLVAFPVRTTDISLEKMLEFKMKDLYLAVNEISSEDINRLYVTDVVVEKIVYVTNKKVKLNLAPILQATSPKTSIIQIRDQTEILKIKRLLNETLSEMIENNMFCLATVEIKKFGNIDDEEFRQFSLGYFKAVCALKSKFTCLKCININAHSQNAIAVRQHEVEICKAEQKLAESGLSFLPEYKKRIEVLKKLGLIQEDNFLTLKGKVAVKFTNNFEIVLTELLFNGTLKDLSPQKFAAVLSCFTDQGLQKLDEELERPLKYELGDVTFIHQQLWEKIRVVLNRVEDLEDEQELYTCERPIHHKLMEGMYEWSLGCDFEQFLKSSGLQEGTLIRFVLRLDEICKEVEKAADHIGNSELKDSAKLCRESIRRDIVNTPSLYFVD